MAKTEVVDGKVRIKKEKRRGRKALKVICIILCVILGLSALTAAVNGCLIYAEKKYAASFGSVASAGALKAEKDEDGYYSFVTDGEFRIMQISDVHIGGGYLSFAKDKMAMNAVAAMVAAEKPDLVVVTGDIVYPVPFQSGTFNNRTASEVFMTLMDTLGVSWVPIFGNHDTEAYSFFSRESIAKLYESDSSGACLFQRGPEDVDGEGNQIINIRNTSGLITQSLFLFDSHSYTDGDIFGAKWIYDNIHANQIDWYKTNVIKLSNRNIKTLSGMSDEQKKEYSSMSVVKSLAFMHIPMEEYRTAWTEFTDNGCKDTADVTYWYGHAGETGSVVYCGAHSDQLFETMLDLGSTKGVFCGHDHLNNFSLTYKGIRLSYTMSIDYLAYPGIYKEGSQRGCNIIELPGDGSFTCHTENYYQDKYTPKYAKESVTMQDPGVPEAE